MTLDACPMWVHDVVSEVRGLNPGSDVDVFLWEIDGRWHATDCEAFVPSRGFCDGFAVVGADDRVTVY